MNRIVRTGAWLLLLAVVLLPFYEIADYTEVWSHDQDFILSALVFLLSGIALVSGKLVWALLTALLRECLQQVPTATSHIRFDRLLPIPMTQTSRVVTLCDLRL